MRKHCLIKPSPSTDSGNSPPSGISALIFPRPITTLRRPAQGGESDSDDVNGEAHKSEVLGTATPEEILQGA